MPSGQQQQPQHATEEDELFSFTTKYIHSAQKALVGSAEVYLSQPFLPNSRSEMRFLSDHDQSINISQYNWISSWKEWNFWIEILSKVVVGKIISLLFYFIRVSRQPNLDIGHSRLARKTPVKCLDCSDSPPTWLILWAADSSSLNKVLVISSSRRFMSHVLTQSLLTL